MVSVAVIGYGHVGRATALAMRAFGHAVSVWDISPEKRASAEADGFPVSEVTPARSTHQAAILCVPTPPGVGGRLDTSAVEAVARGCLQQVLIVRSTLPVGFRLGEAGTRLAYVPCFAREREAEEYETNPSYLVIGTLDSATAHFVSNLWPPHIRKAIVSIDAAQLAKLALNSWLATSITFAQVVFDACAAAEVDYDQIANILRFDRRVGSEAYLVPDKWGGACLPKDVSDFRAQFPSQLLDAVWDSRHEGLALDS